MLRLSLFIFKPCRISHSLRALSHPIWCKEWGWTGQRWKKKFCLAMETYYICHQQTLYNKGGGFSTCGEILGCVILFGLFRRVRDLKGFARYLVDNLKCGGGGSLNDRNAHTCVYRVSANSCAYIFMGLYCGFLSWFRR